MTVENTKRCRNGGADGPAKRTRRSGRLAVLQPVDGSKTSKNVKLTNEQQMAASLPKARRGFKSTEPCLAAPLASAASAHEPTAEFVGAGLGQLPEELFTAAINHLSPRDIASARLVCKAWHLSIDEGLATLKSDNRWSSTMLRSAARKFTTVKTLDLEAASSFTTLAPLRDFCHLQNLRLSHCIISQGELTATLAHLPQLKTLSLLLTFSLRSLNLSSFKHLQRLDLTGCSMLHTLTVSTPLHSLQSLCLRECRGVQQWTFLQMMPALTALDLSYTNANDGTLKYLAALHGLVLLAVLHCRSITDHGILWFTSMPQLKNVYLDGCSSTTASVKGAMQQIMPTLNLIEYCF